MPWRDLEVSGNEAYDLYYIHMCAPAILIQDFASSTIISIITGISIIAKLSKDL